MKVVRKVFEWGAGIDAVFALVSLINGDAAYAAAMIGFAIFLLMLADRA